MLTRKEYLKVIELKTQLEYFEKLHDLLMPGGDEQAFLNVCLYRNNHDGDPLVHSRDNPKLLKNKELFEYNPSLLERQSKLFIEAIESHMYELRNEIKRYIKE